MKAVILLFALIAILVAVNIPAINGEPWAKAESWAKAEHGFLEKLTSWVTDLTFKLKKLGK